jgi:hypothetical protein
MQSVMSLIIGLLLVPSLAAMTVVLNVAFAFEGTGFENKSEFMKYVTNGTKVV